MEISETPKPVVADNSLVLSYLTFRKLIGILGMLLPVCILLFDLLTPDTQMRTSISAYYYSSLRDVFVGVLVVLGLFLISYKGFPRDENITRLLTDKTASTIAGIGALGVAMFPTASKLETGGYVSLDPLPIMLQILSGLGMSGDSVRSISSALHLTFALTLFALFAYMSLRLFTLSGIESRQKIWRKRIYVICGWTVVACIVFNALCFATHTPYVGSVPLVYLFESIGLVAFGISWLAKGLVDR